MAGLMDKDEMHGVSNDRVRMNVSQNSKGLFQLECTVETKDAEHAAELLKQAVTEARRVGDELGLVFTDKA